MEYGELHSKLSQTSKMECFAKIVNGFQLLTNFAKQLILQVSEYAADMFV